jgi:large repetitive protein
VPAQPAPEASSAADASTADKARAPGDHQALSETAAAKDVWWSPARPPSKQPPQPAPSGRPDLDGDGLPDDVDKCPTEPEDVDSFQDQDGCPEIDNDRDGIVDAQDKCPDDPETMNGFQDQDGCPDAKRK